MLLAGCHGGKRLLALRLFRKELHATSGLWEALQKEGFKEYTKALTRSQVRTIVKFLGEP
ncbi:MAG: DUF4248 domain-containing protein [Bacteroidaceae bacterium]|nr:DUF4248 domain-containing protein [Bacteroidaceae bacterium]